MWCFGEGSSFVVVPRVSSIIQSEIGPNLDDCSFSCKRLCRALYLYLFSKCFSDLGIFSITPGMRKQRRLATTTPFHFIPGLFSSFSCLIPCLSKLNSPSFSVSLSVHRHYNLIRKPQDTLTSNPESKNHPGTPLRQVLLVIVEPNAFSGNLHINFFAFFPYGFLLPHSNCFRLRLAHRLPFAVNALCSEQVL